MSPQKKKKKKKKKKKRKKKKKKRKIKNGSGARLVFMEKYEKKYQYFSVEKCALSRAIFSVFFFFFFFYFVNFKRISVQIAVH